ncbi:MAG: NDP-sugar synthase [bacterium]|nr:NDP-sugar synthase [bacterium]
MKFFILAGGYGKRTEPLSLVKPKPAFPLNGTPLINLLLERLKEMDFHEGFINLHHLPEVLRRCIHNTPDLSITYLYEEELSGSKILAQAADYMDEADEFLFILNGDVFLEVSQIPIAKIIGELKETNADGALLLRKNNDPVYKSVITGKGFFKCTEINKGGESLMYTAGAMFRKKVLEKITHTSFFDTLAAADFKIRTYVYDGTWLDIGNPRLYSEADAAFKEHIKSRAINSFSGNVTVSPDSRVSGCIIWENTRVTGGSTLSNCIVTGNMTLHDVNYSGKIIYSQNSEIKIEEGIEG